MHWSLPLLLVACQSSPQSPAEPEPDRPPNVVLILADDLGYECLGVNGCESYATPRLDRMAAEGVRFTDAHATPLCTPSRVELMTGRHGFRNYDRFGFLNPEERTLGAMFHEAGFATCVTGKWQLSYGVKDPKRPAAFGFDTWCLWNTTNDRGSRYGSPRLNVDGELTDFPGDYGPDVCSAHALRFIEEHREEPFFLYVPMILPHAPFQRTPDSPKGERTKGKRFGDMVTYVDTLVGRLLDGLAEKGVAEDTLVLFVGDNGTDRAITTRWSGQDVPGGKSYLRTTGTHVPMIAHWPGTAEPAVLDDLVTLVDFVPTLAQICSLDTGEDNAIDGQSFAPRLRGAPGSPRDWIFWHYDPRWNVPGKPGRAVYDGTFRLHHDGRLYRAGGAGGGDIPLDPAKHSGEVARLQAVLDAMPPWDSIPEAARR